MMKVPEITFTEYLKTYKKMTKAERAQYETHYGYNSMRIRAEEIRLIRKNTVEVLEKIKKGINERSKKDISVLIENMKAPFNLSKISSRSSNG